MTSSLALVALSARSMAEAASREGYEAFVLDVFGDEDTRRSCRQWLHIGRDGVAGVLGIDASRAIETLRALAVHGDVLGWIPGGGCEGQPELLDAGAAALPLIGTAPPDVRRLRDPATFFGALDALGIDHPAWRAGKPDELQGWLVKDAFGTGGWHVRSARAHELQPMVRQGHHAWYWQRRVQGRPMSATFIANGSEACVLGFNETLTCRVAGRRHVFGGVIGPMALPEPAALEIVRATRELSRAFALKGLGSMDFLLDGDAVHVLEVNPRVPASMPLHAGRLPGGVMTAHIRACLLGRLPSVAEAPRGVNASAIVFADHAGIVDDTDHRLLAGWPGCQDRPHPGTHFAAGDPLCSLSVKTATADEARAWLADSVAALKAALGSSNASTKSAKETPE